MKLYIAEVTWYPEDHIQPGSCTDHLVLAAEDFVGAMQNLKEYYGDERVETINLQVINTEDPRVRISKATYEDIKLNGEC